MSDWDRHVQFQACFNFRDLGGYGTTDGHEVQRGVLYRSDSLHRLSPEDLAALAALPVRAVVDLRSDTELVEHGRVADHGDRTFRHVPCEDVSDDYLQPRAEIYFTFAQQRGPQVAHVIQFVAHEEGPIVFHCMAGKDRTGVLAALLLEALGVPDATIAADYALTERSLAPATAWANEHEPEWAAWMTQVGPTGMLSAPAEAMVEFLGKLRAAYGTIDEYFSSIGVDAQTLDALRTRYLV